MKYVITLRDGKTEEITILKAPVYKCYPNDKTSAAYKTESEIAEEGVILTPKDSERPLTLHFSGVGYIEDEGRLFATFKAIRNPIVKLERFETDEEPIKKVSADKKMQMTVAGRNRVVVCSINEHGHEYALLLELKYGKTQSIDAYNEDQSRYIYTDIVYNGRTIDCENILGKSWQCEVDALIDGKSFKFLYDGS